MEGLDFGGVQLHAFCSEYNTIEGNLRLPDPTLEAVKDYAVLFDCPLQVEEVSVMVLRGTAVDAYIIVYHNNARETVCCLVHSHLKNHLGYFQTKGSM